MRVLVIDDCHTMRVILRHLLQQEGFEVIEAGNGVEGLARLEESPPPNLVLVDWNMPGMDGCDFVRTVRGDARFQGLPLMMVTTESAMADVVQALEAGADEYVMKPVTRETILTKLELLGMGRP